MPSDTDGPAPVMRLSWATVTVTGEAQPVQSKVSEYAVPSRVMVLVPGAWAGL